MREHLWALGWVMVAALAVAAVAVGMYYRHPPRPVPPAVVALPLPAPAPLVEAKPLPVFVPTLVWALEGPAPLRAMRLDRVRRFWGITGELQCPTSNPHECVVVHPTFSEAA